MKYQITLNHILWIIQIAVGLMFLFAGANKVLGNEQMVGLFHAVGLGQWFRYMTGFFEIIGAALLFVSPFASLGALVLTGIMAGAVGTHIYVIGGSPVMAIVLLLANVFIFCGRKFCIQALFRK